MTYNEFVQVIQCNVKKVMPDGVKIQIHTSVKNNGIIKKGLLFVTDEVNVSPAIYLEEYYEQFRKGVPVSKVAEEISNIYIQVRFSGSIDGRMLEELADVKGKIIFHLISREKNEQMLKTVPYVPFLDLAVVFYVMVGMNEAGTVTALIKDEHIKSWGLSQEELYKAAYKNTVHLLPYEFATMTDVINQLEGKAVRKKEDCMYVLSNRIRCFGAGALLYEGCLKSVAASLGEDFYVIPSSVHEVIILPKSQAFSRAMLEVILGEMNETHVDREEVLSDRVYYYDCKEGELQ